MVLTKKTGICTICKKEGKTEWHHIISQAKIKRIKPNEYGADLDLMRNRGNLIELCLHCHELTDSHIYWRFHRSQDKKNKINYNKSRRKSSKRKKFSRRGGNQCSHVFQSGSRKGRRCGQKNRKIKQGGFCYYHKEKSSIIEIKHSPSPNQKSWLNDSERKIREKARREERRIKANEFRDKKINSINKLKERGVFIENPPTHRKRDFVRYLKQNLENDESIKNWFDFFHTNYRRINLCKLYPVDHWLHDPNKFDRKLSLNYEKDGFMWTETGFTWHKPVEKKSPEDEIYQEITEIIKLVTGEFTKAKRDIKKELNGVLSYLLFGK
tara:strand:- start:43 stop:1017 length:975 start_codon:yes stop_codon:yes gene_type:complete